jgi:hypothetical protein
MTVVIPEGSVDPVLIGLENIQSFSFTNETGSYDDTTGKWVPVISDPVSGQGSIQPVPKEELQTMIDWQIGGAKILSAIVIFTTADLIAAENGDPSGSVGSTVYHDGLKWKVVMIDDFRPHGHIEAIAVRSDNQVAVPSSVTLKTVVDDTELPLIGFVNGFAHYSTPAQSGNFDIEVYWDFDNNYWFMQADGATYKHLDPTPVPSKTGWVLTGGVSLSPTLEY